MLRAVRYRTRPQSGTTARSSNLGLRAVGSLLFNRTSPQCRLPKWKLVNNDLLPTVTFIPMRGIHFREKRSADLSVDTLVSKNS
jgi:hypothetical protein